MHFQRTVLAEPVSQYFSPMRPSAAADIFCRTDLLQILWSPNHDDRKTGLVIIPRSRSIALLKNFDDSPDLSTYITVLPTSTRKYKLLKIRIEFSEGNHRR